MAANMTSSWQSDDRLLPYLISLRSSLIQTSFPPYVEEMKIELCNSMMYFARSHLPTSIRRIQISRCQNLKSLVEQEEEVDGFSSSTPCLMQGEVSCLQYLDMYESSLASLSSRDQLPRSLKFLCIRDCE
ncbi:hypothetical protein ACE6H2_006206 [Prunus campanulata]